jgi:hypothetical protein
VYDVLNVLVAMEIISKDNKHIVWVGLPSDIPDEQQQLEVSKVIIHAHFVINIHRLLG